MGIVVDGVSKRYRGQVVLDNVSVDLEDGQFLTVLGATGAGKTTLLRIIAGVEQPTEGRIISDGVDVTGTKVQKRDVAMVYQEFINYPSLTIYENIASPIRVSGRRYEEQEIDSQVRYYAELLRIDSVLDHFPEEVSGGQQQRTAIARALAKNVKYVLLDEPLGNLDYKLREELRGELKRIFRNKGGAIIYASPEPIDALAMSSHVAYLQDGRILQIGETSQVYSRPNSVDVGSYFSYPAMNMLNAKLRREGGRSVLVASEEVRIPVDSLADRLTGERYVIGVHAHDITLEPRDKDAIPVNGILELAEVVGSDTELHILHPTESISENRAHEHRLVTLVQNIVSHAIGEEVKLYLDPNAVFIFDQDNRKLVAKTADARLAETRNSSS